MVEFDGNNLKFPIRDLINYLNKERHDRSINEDDFNANLYENAVELLIQKIKETETEIDVEL